MIEKRSTVERLRDVGQYIDDIRNSIGAAIKQVSPEVRAAHPEVNWKGPASLRDLLAHGYFIVDPKIVWETTQSDFPQLCAQVGRILTELDGPQREHANDTRPQRGGNPEADA